jgi:uncharacterized protein (DUF849 family)
MVLQVCLNGDRDEPGVPRSPVELAEAARACVAAGASSIHAHPRDADGHESLAPEDIAASVRALRAAVGGVELSFSTGLWITGGDLEARARAIAGWTEKPDAVSLNLSEEGWRELADLLRAQRVGIEAGIFTALSARELVDSGIDAHRILIEPFTENAEEAIAIGREIDAVLDAAGSKVRRLHHGNGPATWAVIEDAAARGHDIRIGFEDVLTLPDGRRAPDNAALVVEAALRYA